ncbi:MAG: response regulator [Candidatus Electryonea clarkiae]|nr:response regulator [Candidatus Electryonea clarkiae]MDP8285595.1 response regulator [Candidatus Electryonea clarkiae]
MSKLKVLLIDDEVELVSTLVERLAIRGIDAEFVTTGHDALERMSEAVFNVVVLDLKMPGLGGLEVMQVIEEKHPGVKVIIITGHGAGSENTEKIPEGVASLLLKPFSIDNLVSSIHKAVEKNNGES